MNSYDAVPYPSYPYPQTHPDRLATIATLFGMQSPDVRTARVLEIGSAAGMNLLPMAEQLPDATFVGIDYSSRQVEEGQRAIDEIGLENAELRHVNILDVDESLGEFDYILCHGVYSWAPRDVQDKILEICQQNLAPLGVAYVSYNTHPGWRMRGMIRDMMVYRAQEFANPTDRVRQARALLEFLAASTPKEDPYGILLNRELEMLLGKEDAYLYHDHLEEVNDPVYFYQFAERAAAQGLQYVGEADFRVMSIRNFSREVQAMLHSVASDEIQMEQYMDFVRNRTFRQTLLCHQDVVLERQIKAERLLDLHISSTAKPVGEVDVRSTEKSKFSSAETTLETTEPIVKAAMLQMSEIYPVAISFADLLGVARSRITDAPVLVDTGSASADTAKLAEPMLRCFETAHVQLSVLPSPYTTKIKEKPCTTALARYQAGQGNRVTNLRHQLTNLDDLSRHVLPLLDGTRDRAQMIDDLVELVQDGSLQVSQDGAPVSDEAVIRQALAGPLDQFLSSAAANCLLLS
ncbi:MAG: class I SAM-dependent methyltransferase [Pirellulaceae bacterium]|nr:class I SAM-dependent methyltransferase [Pirellulaceae bacterium]MDP7019464.1 class I SAM-dependent methyltransferase [Pirellulaceae bacterium]